MNFIVADALQNIEQLSSERDYYAGGFSIVINRFSRNRPKHITALKNRLFPVDIVSLEKEAALPPQTSADGFHTFLISGGDKINIRNRVTKKEYAVRSLVGVRPRKTTCSIKYFDCISAKYKTLNNVLDVTLIDPCCDLFYPPLQNDIYWKRFSRFFETSGCAVKNSSYPCYEYCMGPANYDKLCRKLPWLIILYKQTLTSRYLNRISIPFGFCRAPKGDMPLNQISALPGTAMFPDFFGFSDIFARLAKRMEKSCGLKGSHAIERLLELLPPSTNEGQNMRISREMLDKILTGVMAHQELL